MLYKKENILKIKELLDSNILILKNERFFFNGELLNISPKTQTYTLYYKNKLFQPKAALVACIALGITIPDKTEINLTSEIIKKENITETVKNQSSYNQEPANRKFTKEICVNLRRDYRSGNFTYRELEKKYNLKRPQIANILYNQSTTKFWSEVNDEEKYLLKGEIVKKTKKQPPRVISKETRIKISEKLKKHHSSGLRPKTTPKPKKEVVKKEITKKENKKTSLFDIFMAEAKSVIDKNK